MAAPDIYSIAAHRGFADALVAGLVPRYSEPDFGLARLTLLLPSTRAARTLSEAFVRHCGENGSSGLLMPRMVMVGDLDLDESLGALFDSLGAGGAIAPAADPTYRWLRLAEIIKQVRGVDAPKGNALLRLAFETGQVIDRLLAEEIAPQDLLSDRVLDLVGDLSEHWRGNLHLFAQTQLMWQAELDERGELDAPARRNLLFREAAKRMKANPPATAYVAAGVTSAAPALAALLRTIGDFPKGAVILPDFDLTMDEQVWDELGSAGDPEADLLFGRNDAVTHPQYHLKLLLNRMGIAREEVRPWHRAGLGKGPPKRSHAIGSLFLPPEASKKWVGLPAKKRRMSGVRLIETVNPEEEAQAIALLVREAVSIPERRVAVITPDRGLAARVVHHLRRWNIAADDSAGQPLSQTTAGRVILLLTELIAHRAAPVQLMALMTHPFAGHENRAEWLAGTRKLERALRGPRLEPGLGPIRAIAAKREIQEFWQQAEAIFAPLLELEAEQTLADWLDLLAHAGEALCGDILWSREDGRALSGFIEELRLHARKVSIGLEPADLPFALRDAMDKVAVRPPYGGHPRVSIYGLLEARMTRADLVICAGLNEGTWPATPGTDPLLAPGVLRVLGVPGADFRIGLSAHDLAGALGAPEVVLSRAKREISGPAIPSRFLLRTRALLGQEMTEQASDHDLIELARELDPAPIEIPLYPQPKPMPSEEQRRLDISVTQLDRLRSDPYQFYASKILHLEELDGLDAEPGPAWQGTLAHKILENWHGSKGDQSLEDLADHHLGELHAHPILQALWRPRLMKALEWVKSQIEGDPDRAPIAIEEWGEMRIDGVKIFGKADRIDRLEDGTLSVVDYKTGSPPKGAQVEAGYALQLGTTGLILQAGGFEKIEGEPAKFEYWSLGKSAKSDTGFGYVETPLKIGNKRGGIMPEDFLPEAAKFLQDALDRWILGEEPFTARLNPDAPSYATYDHLMRLAEWQGRGNEGDGS